ncbi:MAG: sigma-54-dependent Fis family transcriptional regulator [Planctomycetes bacterium]|nr:sigma-54-dependent Fis family transcriptional regulator [Planctomycetota bacterium]
MNPRTALVIDDDALSREFLVETLRTSGWTTSEAGSAEEATRILAAGEFRLVLTDLRLPQADGLAVLRAARERSPETSVVVLTAFGTVATAVEAMRAGADDFLLKPTSPEQIEVVLGRCETHRRLVQENRALKASLTERSVPVRPEIVGRNPRFIQALALAERVASTDATVLVRGESGTGKEVIAELLHRRSARAQGPLIRVNCAALTESLLTSELFGHEKGAFTGATARRQGRFELANGGTLFLDEIGDLPAEVQAKLLRVLETREFERVGGTQTIEANARVVAATNRDLEGAIARGRFREDLFYRLNVVPVMLPPLRERREDIPALARHFLTRFARQHGSVAREFTVDALQAMATAEWPGNVRELANSVQRAVLIAQGTRISAIDLGCATAASNVAAATAAVEVALPSLDDLERRQILKTLEHTRGDRTAAARILGVTTRTLSNKFRLWRNLGLTVAAEV